MRIQRAPVPNEQMMQGSLQYFLLQNTGRYVSVEFLIGTSVRTVRTGIIYYVGTSYMVLYNTENDIYIICNLYSVKFVTMPGTDRPATTPKI